MTLEKVETEPEIYVLPGQDDSEGGAANWFTTEGSVELDADAVMEFPEGKLSIKCTIGQVCKNPEAKAMFEKMAGREFGPDMPMWGMLENFTVEMSMGMAGNLPEGAMALINKKLNAFDIVE